MFSFAKKSLVAAAAALAITGAAGQAEACGYYYKNVTTYVTVQKPIAYYVTRYDHCGEPYEVLLTSHKTVRVPVTHRVKVAY